jgi:hypothetical protein
MKHASFPVAGSASAPLVVAGQNPRRIGFLTLILETLHHSRRIEARRFLRAHRHLIASGPDSRLENTGGDTNVDC